MRIFYIFWITLLPCAYGNNLPGNNALDDDQVLSNLGAKKSNSIGSDQVLSNIENELDRVGISDQELRENIQRSRQYFQNLQSGKFQPPTARDEITLIESAPVRRLPIGKREVPKRIKKKRRFKRRSITSGIQVYGSPYEPEYELAQTITLPSAALTPATLMAGVEVSTEKRLVDVQIDYAFVGPNGAVVDMKDCHTWIQVWGNYNTERIYGETQSISCRAANGKTFDIPIKGQLRDARDEYIGIKAKLVTRGKIAAAALSFLQEGTKQFGKAMAAAQVRTEVVGGGINSTSERGENITGSQGKYIAGETIAGATGGFLHWWIDYYKGLSPTLAIAPGTKVYFSVKKEIQIPIEFFEQGKGSKLKFNTKQSLSSIESES